MREIMTPKSHSVNPVQPVAPVQPATPNHHAAVPTRRVAPPRPRHSASMPDSPVCLDGVLLLDRETFLDAVDETFWELVAQHDAKEHLDEESRHAPRYQAGLLFDSLDRFRAGDFWYFPGYWLARTLRDFCRTWMPVPTVPESEAEGDDYRDDYSFSLERGGESITWGPVAPWVVVLHRVLDDSDLRAIDMRSEGGLHDEYPIEGYARLLPCIWGWDERDVHGVSVRGLDREDQRARLRRLHEAEAELVRAIGRDEGN